MEVCGKISVWNCVWGESRKRCHFGDVSVQLDCGYTIEQGFGRE